MTGGDRPDCIIIDEVPVGWLSVGHFETTIQIHNSDDDGVRHSELTQYPRRFVTGSTAGPWFVDDEWSGWARETNARVARDDELRRARREADERADLAEDVLCDWEDARESSHVITHRLAYGRRIPERPVRFSWLHGPEEVARP